MVDDTDTIFALSSGSGAAGVAVIRISGSAVLRVLKRMVAGRAPLPRLATLRTLRHPVSQEVLDRGLVLHMPGPGSFTGEDCLEFHVHGGRAVTRAVLAALECLDGLRPAEPGEFTRRAFDHGRLDLTNVEGLAELVAAETESQRRLALKVASGALSEIYLEMREAMLEGRALLEAQIDFSDEDDVEEIDAEPVISRIDSVRKQIATLLAGAPVGKIVREGFKVVLAGAPNAGKSSLLNQMSGRDVAIVSDEAGTTRDIIEVRMELDGQLVLLQDSAGIRRNAGSIESQGVERAQLAIRDADLVIALEAHDAPLPPWALADVTADVLHVWNKIDAAGPSSDSETKHDSLISVLSGAGIGEFLQKLAAIVRSRQAVFDSVPVHMRHARSLNEADRLLVEGRTFLRAGDWELGADCLQRATSSVDVILGRAGVEDVLDVIFSRFCIGK